MPYCQNCGVEIESGEKFCAACGTPIAKLGKRPAAARARATVTEAPSRGEVMENCGDDISYGEHSEAPSAQVAPGKGAKTRRTFSKGTRRIMFLAGIAIIVVALVGAYMISGGSQGRVPVYPGATELMYEGQTEELLTQVYQSLPASWSAKMYQTTAFTGTIMNWYRSNMSEWTDVYDNIIQITSDMPMGILGFTNGSDGAFIISVDVAENHYFITMTGPAVDMQNLISGNF